MYRPADLNDLPGITRLANSLNAVVQLATIDTFLAAKAVSYDNAMAWLQLAEQCGLDKTWAAGVRALAETFITLPEGLPLTYRAANGLGRLGRETIIAVVAAMAAALQRVDSHLLTQAASTIPDDAVLLAGRNEAALGSASLLWEVPQLAAVREKRESPAFGPATKSGSSASAPMFKLEVQGPTIEEAPYGFGFGNPPQGACLSATLAVTYKDEWPPGTALAAFIMVKLLGQNGVVVVAEQQSLTLSPSTSRTSRQFVIGTSASLQSRLANNAGKGTFKVEVEWLELQANAREE